MLKTKGKGISINEFGEKIELNSKKGTGKVHKNTIYEFLGKEKNIKINTLEKILLNDAVSDEALDFFIKGFRKLLKYYRNYSYEDEETVDENAELEDVVLGGSQGRNNLRKSGRIITPANFQRNQEIMESIGHKGEKCVNAYLQKLKMTVKYTALSGFHGKM